MPNTTKDNDLEQLFIDQLRDILWAEKHLLKALPKMANAANDVQLKAALTTHRDETEQHVSRLNEIFDILGLAPGARKCAAMEGLLTEGDELSSEYADSPALDAALIAAAQKVEHYEIATYGTLRAFARRLDNQKAVKLLTKTVDEEAAADEKLTKIAEGSANAEAEAEAVAA
jgi:ferritin-like metal-binding protein YciE